MTDQPHTDFVVHVGKECLDTDTGGQTVKVVDKGGESLFFISYRGVNYGNVYKVSLLEKIPDFEMRPDDIYIPGYPRTGTHWTYEKVCMLLQGKAETISHMKHHIELLPQEEFRKLPSPRVVNAHVRMADSPVDLMKKKCKVVFPVRDPRDVAVSLYNIYHGRRLGPNYYNGSFRDYLGLFLEDKVDFNGIFDHWQSADTFFNNNPNIPVFIHVYEEALMDPVRSVQQLSDFLGLQRNDQLCREIAEKCNFSKMKVDKDEFTMKVNGENFLYRQGVSGDWKNYFTDDMLEEYYRVYRKKLAGTKFYDYYS